MPPEPEQSRLREAVWAELEAQEAELIALTRELIRTPSVNGLHPEAEVAQVIADALGARGVPACVLAYEADRPNVLANLGDGEAAVLFVGHMDTVAVGDRGQWSFDPFAATVHHGRIYGRGACDNKAGIAIAITLLGVLKGHVDRLAGQAMLCCVPDEETGATGRLGIKPLLRDGHLLLAQAVYTYPGLDFLSIGHRGLMRVRLIAQGQATHTGGDAWETRQQGANAVTAMAELLLRLEAWAPAFSPHPAFPGRRPVVTPGTLMRGGEMESMVPARAEAIVDLRLLPGQESQVLLDQIQAFTSEVEAQRPGIRFAWEKLVDLPAVSIPESTPLVQALARWTETLTGARPTIAGAGPANEGYLLIEAGIPTVCGFGPPGGNAHAADEYVEVSGLLLTAKIYAAALLDLLVPDTPA